jgi:transposase
MNVTERRSGDLAILRRLVRKERDAEQRNRYRVTLLAIEDREINHIADSTGCSRRFVQRWDYAYRDEGLEAIAPKPRPGRARFLSDEQREAVAERVRAGATAGDAKTVLRGKDPQDWIDSPAQDGSESSTR